VAEPDPTAKAATPRKGQQGVGRSFVHAYNGLVSVVRTQRNMRIHVLVACCVLAASLPLGLDAVELAIVVLTIVVVLATEMLNTALEFAVDLTTREFHPLAKLAKDVSAAAVFVASLGAVAVGLLVVADELMALWPTLLTSVRSWAGALALVALGLVFLIPVMLKALARTPRSFASAVPSGHAAVAFAAWVAATFVAAEGSARHAALVSVLVLLLALLVCQSRIENGARTLREVASGAALGTLIAFAAFVLL
jgi:diacylglycerol kinase (ATP)